jgi:hypothetical protein
MDDSNVKKNTVNPLVKFLTILMSIAFALPGLLSIINNRYYAYSSRYNVEILIEGRESIVIGIGIIIFGLFPLAILAKNRKLAVLWASFCLFLGIIIMVLSKLFTHLIFA